MSKIEGEKEQLKTFLHKEEDKLNTARQLQKEFSNNDELKDFYRKKIEEYQEALKMAKERIKNLDSKSQESEEDDQ